MLERGALRWDIAPILYVAGDNNTSAMRNNAVLVVRAVGGVALYKPNACLQAYARPNIPNNDTVAEGDKAERE